MTCYEPHNATAAFVAAALMELVQIAFLRTEKTRATGQVGTQVADAGRSVLVLSRRCVKAKPFGRSAAVTGWACGI